MNDFGESFKQFKTKIGLCTWFFAFKIDELLETKFAEVVRIVQIPPPKDFKRAKTYL